MNELYILSAVILIVVVLVAALLCALCLADVARQLRTAAWR